MNIPIFLNPDNIQEPPYPKHEWKNGDLIGFTTGSHNICYGIVKTEHGEFVLVQIQNIIER